LIEASAELHTVLTTFFLPFLFVSIFDDRLFRNYISGALVSPTLQPWIKVKLGPTVAEKSMTSLLCGPLLPESVKLRWITRRFIIPVIERAFWITAGLRGGIMLSRSFVMHLLPYLLFLAFVSMSFS
jgi:hypothetical protein